MGWRTQNAYDEAAEAERRALSWRERIPLTRIAALVLVLAIVGAYLWANIAH